MGTTNKEGAMKLRKDGKPDKRTVKNPERVHHTGPWRKAAMEAGWKAEAERKAKASEGAMKLEKETENRYRLSGVSPEAMEAMRQFDTGEDDGEKWDAMMGGAVQKMFEDQFGFDYQIEFANAEVAGDDSVFLFV